MIPIMNSGLSDVAKTQKAPALKNVGAMLDNPIERSRGRKRRGYGFNIFRIPPSFVEWSGLPCAKVRQDCLGRRKKSIVPPSPKGTALTNYAICLAAGGGSLERNPLPQCGQTLKFRPRIFCSRSITVADGFD